MIFDVLHLLNRPHPPATDDQPGIDRFGFLPIPASCDFDGGSVAPVANYEEVAEWVRLHLYRGDGGTQSASGQATLRGVLFPPLKWERETAPITGTVIRDVPHSEQPALLHRVAASHQLRLDGFNDPTAERERFSGFVIKVLGFLYDTPTQFHDWWFDGAVSVGKDCLFPAPVVLSDFLSHACRTWKQWSPDAQQLIVALLKMHLRAPGYQWYWERFAWEYTVTDACYKLADTLHPKRFRVNGKRPPHEKRIEIMCTQLGLAFGADQQGWAEDLVELRNGLIHEARWASHQVSTKTPGRACYAPTFTHSLNQRLITALLGYSNQFVETEWHLLAPALFDLKT
jgi:hypothetical protein